MEKPGFKTTEFWISTGAAVVGGLVASGAIPTEGPWMQVIGLVSAALVALGYTGARLNLKKTEAEAAEYEYDEEETK
tara:strand:- start:4215 stop:4445 length:231 start_codon:yes stop_codon:yes gene_type:complete